MAKQHPIDQFFADKMAAENISFNSAHWEAAKQLIADDNKKAIAWWWFTFPAAVFIGLLIIYFNPHSNPDSNDVAHQELIISDQKGKEELVNKEKISFFDGNNLATKQHKKNNNTKKYNTPITKKEKKKKPETGNNDYISGSYSFSSEDTLRQNKEPMDYWVEPTLVEKITAKNINFYKAKNSIAAYSFTHKNTPMWIKNSTIGLIVGPAFSLGLKNAKSSHAPITVSPVIGLRYGYRINDYFSFDFNLLYSNRKGLNAERINYLDAQSTKIATINTTKSIHYIDIPLYFNYRSERYHIHTGLQYAQLIGAMEEIKTPTDLSSFRSWTKGTAFSKTDISLLLGYSYVLNEQFNVGLRTNLGLFDITENGVFDSFEKDRNIQLRLLIDYKLK